MERDETGQLLAEEVDAGGPVLARVIGDDHTHAADPGVARGPTDEVPEETFPAEERIDRSLDLCLDLDPETDARCSRRIRHIKHPHIRLPSLSQQNEASD